MAQLRVLLGFAAAPDHDLEETTGHVLNSLYAPAGAAIYPAPPVVKTALTGALAAFTAAIPLVTNDGESAALKDQKRAALVALLRQLALYVQTVIQGPPALGLAQLLASGFDAVSTSRAQQPLATPAIREIVNSGEGSLTLRVSPVRNARVYEVERRLEPPAGPAAPAEMFSSTRAMVVTGLTPGALYRFRVRAVGGATGQSEWSDAVTHRSL